MKDLTILMDLEIGRPTAIVADATSRDVPILASCLFPRLGGRVAHAAVRDEDVPVMRAIADAHGAVVADVRDCVIVPADHPGGWQAAAAAISESKIMVNLAYFGARGEMILATADIDRAKQAIGLD